MSKNPEEIINRVARSKLVTFNLEDYYPAGRRVLLDIKDWLFHGIVLREKEYRNFVADHDWQQYQDTFVALTCSTDAIIPGWAYMLIMTKLGPYAQEVVIGDFEQLETSIYRSIINKLDVSEFKDKPVIIKGCTKKPVPSNAYLWVTAKLQTVAASVMYGEACSSVPLFKK